jgi:hypothetical protein
LICIKARSRYTVHRPFRQRDRPGDPGAVDWGGRRTTMDHTRPVAFPEDETSDIGMGSRTPLALVAYGCGPPFRFAGPIERLTFDLRPEGWR